MAYWVVAQPFGGVAAGFVYVVGGSPDAVSATTSNFKYDTVADSWTTKAAFPFSRSWWSGFAVGGFGYAAGGGNTGGGGYTAQTDVRKYDPVGDAWSSTTSLSATRAQHGGFADGVFGYVVGGNVAGDSASVDKFDPAGPTWTATGALSTARREVRSTYNGTNGYATGGHDSGLSTFYTTHEQFNGSTWATKTAMTGGGKSEVSEFSSIVGRVYAAGGRTGGGSVTTDVREYNPIGDSWAAKTAMTTARGGLNGASINDLGYAIGGHNGSLSSVATSVERYSIDSDAWSTVSAMPSARRAYATMVMED